MGSRARPRSPACSTARSCRRRKPACSSSICRERVAAAGDRRVTAHRIAAAWVLPNAADPTLADRTITVADGRIAALEAGGSTGALVLPALANAHDHARVVRLSQIGSFDVPLEAWLPYLALVPAVDPWLASAVSFGRIARGGIGSTMAHYTRVQGLTDFPTEARAVAKAARDVGAHVALAVHCRDLNPLVYDPHQA